MAEGVGFEPTVPQRGTTVFETAPIDRSGTSPHKRCQQLSTFLSGTSREHMERVQANLDLNKGFGQNQGFDCLGGVGIGVRERVRIHPDSDRG